MKSCGSSHGALRNQVGWNSVKVGGEPEPVPVGDVALRDRRLEALRLRDRPVREQAAAAAAGHAEPIRVDVAFLQHFVDAGHQVLVVVAGVVELDDVAEVLTVGGAAARVGEEDHVALRRHPLELVRVDVAVRRVRPAVNLENHRVLLAGVEVRRLQNPALHLLAVERSVPDFFGLALLDVLEQIVVDLRDLSRLGPPSAACDPITKMSPMLVCVEIVAAIFDASGVAL